ncbi:MAG: hypothetical protein CR974_03450, partial [Gammaproteobacteria bacterium]
MITQQDLVTAFSETEIAELSDHENAAVIDAAVVDKAITEAVAEAQSYLNAAGLTAAVLTPVPVDLRGKLCDIARYRLSDDGVTDTVDERYKLAIAWLKDVMRNPAMLVPGFNPSDQAGNINSGVDSIANPKPN